MGESSLQWATGSELATVLSLTPQRVGQLLKDGVVVAKPEDGSTGPRLYDLPASVRGYINFLIEKEASKNADVTELDKRRQEAETRYKAAKARKAELEIRELEGRMHRAEYVEAVTNKLVSTVKGLFTSLPGRLAVSVVEAKTEAEAAQVIQQEVNAMLLELSGFKYSKDEYDKLVRQREDWQTKQKVESDDPGTD